MNKSNQNTTQKDAGPSSQPNTALQTGLQTTATARQQPPSSPQQQLKTQQLNNLNYGTCLIIYISLSNSKG